MYGVYRSKNEGQGYVWSIKFEIEPLNENIKIYNRQISHFCALIVFEISTFEIFGLENEGRGHGV